jgi:DNA-directed RNA polymerase subunit M/transcription elongation factor TFIIS
MDCPQCGGSLATYALSDREASVCEDCGYVGIAAEHRGESRTVESWDDALRRFYHAHDTDAEPGVELRPPLSRPSTGSSDESWDDALRRFYARTGAADEEAVDEEVDREASDESDDDTAHSDDPTGVEADASGGQ